MNKFSCTCAAGYEGATCQTGRLTVFPTKLYYITTVVMIIDWWRALVLKAFMVNFILHTYQHAIAYILNVCIDENKLIITYTWLYNARDNTARSGDISWKLTGLNKNMNTFYLKISTNAPAAHVTMMAPAMTKWTSSVALVPVDSWAPSVRLVGHCLSTPTCVTWCMSYDTCCLCHMIYVMLLDSNNQFAEECGEMQPKY